MALAVGTRLGPYEILEPAGAGGMGEVYKARDTRLERTVAIKILPSELMLREDLRQRLEREARAVSSLNHAHICTLYDVGRQDGIDYLVMEFLEGETLEARLRKGPLPMGRFFEIAAQVGEALDQAHQRGLVHRDMKPANIMLTKTGAKLLDFGLAKVKAAPASSSAGISTPTALPTMTHALTQEGTIVGTFQYMAPEQLEGQEADARSDIFAFGAVLYEMATGRRAFEGRSQATLISAIMTAEPAPLSAGMAEAAPPALDHVVRRCLAKDPADRWQSVHDLLLELKWLAQAGSAAGVPAPVKERRKKRERTAWGVAAVLALAALGEGAAILLRARPEERTAVRFTIAPPLKVAFNATDSLAVSPDGRRLVFTGTLAGQKMMWHRLLDSLTVEPLAGTEGAYFPFWSPDSRFVAFFADHKLKKIDITGGPAQTICEVPGTLFTNGSWNRDGTIVFTFTGGRMYTVAAGGGDAKPLLDLDAARQERLQFWPQFLPDGRHFLFYSASRDPGKSGIVVGALDSKQTVFLLHGSGKGAYVKPGLLLFERQGTLLSQPFDAAKLRLTGEATPLATMGPDVSPGTGSSRFSASENGTLVYHGGGTAESRMTWYARDGKRLGVVGDAGIYMNMGLSPDEKRLALQRNDAQSGMGNIWVLELASGILTRLTFEPVTVSDPVWSPDGREVVYRTGSRTDYIIARKPVGGGPQETLFDSKTQLFAQDSLKDGSLVCLNLNGRAFYRLPVTGEKKLETLVDDQFDKDEPHVSPDGKWIAYNSTESGRWEVYVAAFPSFTEKRQISNGGACQPLWRKDGKEIFYLTLDGEITAMDVKAGAELETGPPRTLFQTKLSVSPIYDQYRVTGDGQKFVVAEPVDDTARPFTVVVK